MKTFRFPLVIFAILLLAITTRATEPSWTWISGVDMQRNQGYYETLGVGAPINTPPSLYEPPYYCPGNSSWTGKDGKFYLLTGDLWRFDPATRNWAAIANYSNVHYGTRGVESGENAPDTTRTNAAQWTDKNGRLWLFGGYGYDSDLDRWRLNDLWRYDPVSCKWTWMKGNKIGDQLGVYGTKGEADSSNTPGGLQEAVAWAGADGKLWLFGGDGCGEDADGEAYGLFNALWRYDTANNKWTWVKGSKNINQAGVYGTRGEASSSNTPGSRRSSATWTTADGKLWLFGGYGYGASSASKGELNDLWRYDPGTNKWTWIKGNNDLNRKGVYGTLGIADSANNPGGREGASTWIDDAGRLYLQGGMDYDSDNDANYDEINRELGLLNDLWRFDPATNNWTWIEGSKIRNQSGIYGTLGSENSANVPGARKKALSWRDQSGRMWLFGGQGYDSVGLLDGLNDLWRYNPATGNWAWFRGCNSRDIKGVYGTKGVSSKNNKPGARAYSATWIDNTGKLWLFGGYGADAQGINGCLDDLWQYDPATSFWTWVHGHDRLTIPDFYDLTQTNRPLPRDGASAWVGLDGKFYMVGGYWEHPRYSIVRFVFDFQCYDPKSGTWEQGYDPYQHMQGVHGASSWTGKDGKLWLFGGGLMANDADDPSESEFLSNQLAYYDPVAKGHWVVVRDTNEYSPKPPIYGTRGVEASENTPGGRKCASAWTDKQGRLWLFGGYGEASSGEGQLNDLWRYDPATDKWAWIKGSNLTEQASVHGTRDVAAPANTPGARSGAMAWTDPSGKLWLSGGYCYYSSQQYGFRNELWCFDPDTENWTWVAGSKEFNQLGIYGLQGIASNCIRPGSMNFGMAWSDANGSVWLFGGRGYDSTTGATLLGDLWRMTSPKNAVDDVVWRRMN